MTHDDLHDELLIEVLRRLNVSYYNGDPQSMNALRTVVELHRPFDGYCQRCTVKNRGEQRQKYPCDEIQAIEKELK